MLTFSYLKETTGQKVMQGTSSYRIEYWLVPGVTLHIGAKHRVQIFLKHFTDAMFPCQEKLTRQNENILEYLEIWVLFIKFTIYKMIVQSCLDMLKFLLSDLIVQNKWYVDIFYYLIWLYKLCYNTSRSDRMVLIFFSASQMQKEGGFFKVPRPFVNKSKFANFLLAFTSSWSSPTW